MPRLFLTLTSAYLLGCAPTAGISPASGAPQPLAITLQPANQSVPMGLTGSFTVQATGSADTYQWSRNGSPIPGATGNTYTTPPTTFADTGATFQVQVRDASNTVTSQSASLTVTARAPLAGDLRFQQVDAPSTINGYSIDSGAFPSALVCPAAGQGSTTLSAGSATSTPIFLNDLPCFFQSSTFSLPAGLTGSEVGWTVVGSSQWASTLIQPFFGSGATPSDLGSVITSLYVKPDSVSFTAVHSASVTGFSRSSYTVPAAGLQALATQEGLKGRVITALSYDGTNSTVYSYAWSGDPSNTYDTRVVFGTLTTATDLITSLAADGYILTASGSTQASDGSGVVLVGTKVHGDTMPRPILVGDALQGGSVLPPFAQGYATVAVVTLYDPVTGQLRLKNYIGER